MAHTFPLKWKNVPFLSGASQCIAQSSSTLQQPRNEPWGEFFFLCQRQFPRWSAKFNLNFKDGKSFGALRGKCDREQIPSAEKKKTCDAIKSEIFPGAEIMPTNFSTKNWKTCVSKRCTKATGLAWASVFSSQPLGGEMSAKNSNKVRLPSYSTQIYPDLTSQTQICSVYNDVKQIKRWKSSYLRNCNQPMFGKLVWSTFHRV